MLHALQNLVDGLSSTNSSKEKIEILKQHPECKELLKWVYNPYRKFGITSDQLKKNNDKIAKDSDWKYSGEITELLDALETRVVTGYKAIEAVNWYIKYSKYGDLIYRIIDKDLQVRLDAKSINKAFPGLIPIFEVALAEDYFKQKSVDYKIGWVWSRKLDGVRCIARIENGNVTLYSRKGHEFETLNTIKTDLLDQEFDNCVLDGEICLVDKNGNENFQDVMKEIRRKNHTIENPKYMIFDYLTLEEFDSGKGEVPLMDRYYRLYKNNIPYNHLEVVIQTPISQELKSEEDIMIRLDEATKRGWEGLILRRNIGYEGKRSKNMLKVKKMHDNEYIVKEAFIGQIDNGTGNKVEGLSAVLIDHKGFDVKVGSGFTFEQRIRFKDHQDEIIGKIITVQYFEETTDQHGNHSLRFPIVKAIHGDNREV